HKSYIEKLRQYGLLERALQGYLYPLDTPQEKEKETATEPDKEMFEKSRLLYPGTKLGLGVEFSNFCKKHKNFKEILPLLYPAIESQIKQRKSLKDKGKFVPEWKHFKTWINNSGWEMQYGGSDSHKTPPKPRKCLTCDATGTVYINDRVKLCTSCNALYESAPEEKSFKGHVIPKSMIDDIRIKEIIEGLRQ
ncbi:hypothetical protein DRJ16_07070, partial [Candidatus Woesearchaeota archaeon]